MQTFIVDADLDKSAQELDSKRLGNQRSEAIMIAEILLGLRKSRWQSHPAVQMWKGYEGCLVRKYIPSILREWRRRGFANGQSLEKYKAIYKKASSVLSKKHDKRPHWINQKLILSHRSNLIKKKPEYYWFKWRGTTLDLDYFWPTKEK